MIIKNSIRQLLRMKGRTVLFLLLLLFASGLLSLGRGFWIINREKTAAYEDTFMTIGTVEQKEDTVKEMKYWDAGKQEYVVYARSVYHSLLPVSILDLEGVTYLSGPEKRICYGAYLPDYQVYGNENGSAGMRLGFLVEASPVEDAVPDHPVKIRIRKVWKGFGLRENDTIFLCDHYNPEPEMLHADKTYLMYIHDVPSHGGGDIEFVPLELGSTQKGPDGETIPCELEEDYWCEEITEDFWESEQSRWWRNLMEVWDYPNHMIPVTGTCNVELLMAFYNGTSYVTSGRTFTEEEYEQGEKVCLIHELFAGKYGLEPGDQIRLPLLAADHAWSAGATWTTGGGGIYDLLNAKGEPYEVFEDSSYTIVGIYGGGAGQYDDYGMGYNEILIPDRSVKNSDADNIVRFGPMRGSTTSFQIENGTIEDYMEKWGRLGIDNVEITFYDRGYTELKANLDNMKQIARILMVVGIAMVLMVAGYFSWIFILRQRERTAVERSLGLRKSQCFLSLFCGIFLILLVGALGGCTAGSLLSGRIAGSIGQKVYYDTSFGSSAGVQETESAENENMDALNDPYLAALQNTLLILAAGTVISGTGIFLNLRQEPMSMFGNGRE